MKAFITEFVKQHNVIEQLNSSFQENMKNYRTEHPEEFNSVFENYRPELLKTWVIDVAYKLRNYPEWDYEVIQARLQMEYDGEYIGYYLLEFNIEGEIIDDVFWG